MKKRIIISITLVLLVFVGLFIFMRFSIVGQFITALFGPTGNIYGPDEKNPEDNPEDFKYVTEKDKDGNEFVVEYQRKYLTDSSGEEVEAWLQTEHSEMNFDYVYHGTIEKIEDNKIYFMVDREGEEYGPDYKDVEDYEIVFDLDTFDFDEEGDEFIMGRYYPDGVSIGMDFYYRACDLDSLIDGLEELKGKYLYLQYAEFEDPYTGDRSLELNFQE